MLILLGDEPEGSGKSLSSGIGMPTEAAAQLKIKLKNNILTLYKPHNAVYF